MRSPEENLGEIARIVGHFFPHHEEALKGLLIKGKMSNDRWNSAAAVLASLTAVPGSALSAREQTIRAIGLMGVNYARSMARVTFGGADSGEAEHAARTFLEAIFENAAAISP